MCLKTDYHLAHPYLESATALSDNYTQIIIIIMCNNYIIVMELAVACSGIALKQVVDDVMACIHSHPNHHWQYKKYTLC